MPYETDYDEELYDVIDQMEDGDTLDYSLIEEFYEDFPDED